MEFTNAGRQKWPICTAELCFNNAMSKALKNSRALMFDVFGTLVDWRSSVRRSLESFFDNPDTRNLKPADVCWETVALDWRGRYQPSMDAVRQGQRNFVILDVLHKESLIETLADHGFSPLDDNQLTRLSHVWHQLDAWPEVPAALASLRQHKVLAALSNGNTQLLKNLSRYAKLDWHVSLGAEPTRAYKPESHVYLQSAALLALEPSECMMVAAHNDDLSAARDLGFRTAYINRPTEYGSRQTVDIGPTSDWDIAVESLDALLEYL
ncbi:MAG: haloacid dehalogenase type II [Granulosicoccus sp.]